MPPEQEAGRLSDLFGASLYRYALMILANREAAEDVIQQVFVALVHPDGFVVYSVGFNRADDGGRGAGAQLRRRWGANQTNAEPPDIGVNVRAQKED